MLMEQIDDKFTRRFKFLSFRPGNNSKRHQLYSRAYNDFQRPEDVIEFAEYFGGHVFVNEKVEYAPSQRVPKQWSKKDGREGSIYKDPEYMEFLEFIAKPVENLPSAEIRLERRDAERAGAVKDAPVVTPLMDFIRQRRAAKAGSRKDDFWNEAIKLADLHHPNVAAFYGVVLDGPGGSVATVTEYMVNGSLRTALLKNAKYHKYLRTLHSVVPDFPSSRPLKRGW